MFRNVVFVVILLMISASIMTGVNENGLEKALADIETLRVFIEPGSQDQRSQSAIFFKHDEEDKTQYFVVDVRIQVRSVNIILLLDESLSMNTYDIEDFNSPTPTSRINNEKRISRQILGSINPSSNIAVILFGGDEIREYGFESNRKEFESVISGMAPEGKESCGGESLRRAIEIAVEGGRQAVIVIMTDALEIGEDCSKFIDVVGNAENNKIVIYSVLLGKEGSELDMKEIAERTNGFFFAIDEERDISSLISALTNSVDEYYLEDLMVNLRAPTGVYLEEVLLENKQLEMAEKFFQINRIGYEEPVILKMKFGVTGSEMKEIQSPLSIFLDISFKDSLQDSTWEISVHLADIPLRFETESEYIKRKTVEFVWTYKFYIILSVLLIITCVFLLVRRKRKSRKPRKELEYHIKRAYHEENKQNYRDALENWESTIQICKEKKISILKKLRKEYEEHISKANYSEGLHDYEEAMEDLEKAIQIGNILKDKSVADLSKRRVNLKKRISQLNQEMNLTESILGDIFLFLERIRKEGEKDLQRFEGYEILKEEMGPHLDIEHLRKKALLVREKKDLEKIREKRKKLDEVRKILLKILNKVT